MIFFHLFLHVLLPGNNFPGNPEHLHVLLYEHPVYQYPFRMHWCKRLLLFYY